MLQDPPSHRHIASGVPEQLRRGTAFLVETGRGRGLSDDQIREAVRMAFQGGITVEAPRSTWARFLSLGDNALVDPGSVDSSVSSKPGVDRTNQVAQETWWTIVEDAMEKSL
jgi:hypothetical protein